jgi:hypothetical protein
VLALPTSHQHNRPTPARAEETQRRHVVAYLAVAHEWAAAGVPLGHVRCLLAALVRALETAS